MGAIAAIVPATLKADPVAAQKYLGSAIGTLLVFLQIWAWAITPSCLLLAALAGFLQKRYGDPAMWGILHEMLDEFRSKVFSDTGSEYQHHHRVTLFKHSKWAFVCRQWPWSGWLIPVERSGHTTQTSRTIFRAPDDSDKCEGVAGLAWCANGALKISDLPALSPASTDATLVEYGNKTGVNKDWLRARCPKGRSFYGVRVEAKKGTPWGVIVIDSRRETINFKRVTAHWDVIGNHMSRILERV